jgi:hypothetical protein
MLRRAMPHANALIVLLPFHSKDGHDNTLAYWVRTNPIALADDVNRSYVDVICPRAII